jgi:hypothetical protein
MYKPYINKPYINTHTFIVGSLDPNKNLRRKTGISSAKRGIMCPTKGTPISSPYAPYSMPPLPPTQTLPSAPPLSMSLPHTQNGISYSETPQTVLPL